ncbi:MAG: hypothetical protein A2000_03035 [Ignavibacteria bacterium GWB2_36_8]|nr:MAG: hypothetical protein A2000_03035 [Ignavibacteria bacterium GWB2_36_8]OGU52258.1 MAG: hypothetical protein A2080_08330 [Ignavibacteria bacterium GWC2_36_12]
MILIKGFVKDPVVLLESEFKEREELINFPTSFNFFCTLSKSIQSSTALLIYSLAEILKIITVEV